MKYRTLLFDADGTLYDFEKTEEISLRNFYEKQNLSCTFSDFESVYLRENALLWQALERGEVTAGEVKVNRFVNTMVSLGLYEGNGEELSRLFIDELAQCDFLLPGAEELIDDLADSYEMYIITNGLWDVQRRRIGESELYRKHFKGLVVSEKVGAAKPDARIFDEALRTAGNPPIEEMLIIGDSLTSDIRGGDLYGMDTCWYNPGMKKLSGPSKPTYEVRSFMELAQLLGGPDS